MIEHCKPKSLEPRVSKRCVASINAGTHTMPQIMIFSGLLRPLARGPFFYFAEDIGLCVCVTSSILRLKARGETRPSSATQSFAGGVREAHVARSVQHDVLQGKLQSCHYYILKAA